MKITIESKEKQEEELAHGQYFAHRDGGVYLLSQASYGKYCLINLENGYKWICATKSIEDVFDRARKDFRRVYPREFIFE